MHEDKFILNAARLNLSQENISVLKEISSNGIDWDSFEKKASMHGVSTFIYYSLTNQCLSDLIPEIILNNFKRRYYATAIRNMQLLEKLKKIAYNTKCRLILLKGMDLIQNLYPNIAIRSMSDIDILVEKENTQRLWNSLKNIGFLEMSNKSGFNHKLEFQYNGHLPALYSDNVVVEVHWYLFGKDFIDKNFLDITTKSCDISGLEKNNFYVFTNEVRLIHLCLHFCLHLENGAILRMLCDINEIILKYSNTINWRIIDKICTDLDLTPFVYPILTYANILMHTPVPESLLSIPLLNDASVTLDSLLTGRVKSLQKILNNFTPKNNELINKSLEIRPKIRRNKLSNHIFYLSKLDNLSDKLIYIFRLFFPVKEWMQMKNYNTSNSFHLGLSYLKYCNNMFNRHVLKRSISGNQ